MKRLFVILLVLCSWVSYPMLQAQIYTTSSATYQSYSTGGIHVLPTPHNPLPSFCGEMLRFPIFFHRRHFGWILFLLNVTSFIFEHFPAFCDRKVPFTQVLLFVLVFVFYFFAAVFQIYLVLSLPQILHQLFDSRSSGFF